MTLLSADTPFSYWQAKCHLLIGNDFFNTLLKEVLGLALILKEQQRNKFITNILFIKQQQQVQQYFLNTNNIGPTLSSNLW